MSALASISSGEQEYTFGEIEKVSVTHVSTPFLHSL